MMSRRFREPAGRGREVVVKLGFALGFLLGAGNCCDDGPPEPAASYRIEEQGSLDDPSELGMWVRGSGVVRVEDDSLVITYTTTDGAAWEVEYRQVGVVEE